MSAETGQLQRLTDEQVNARLAAYNGDGSLERDVKLLREKVGDLIESEVRNHFGAEAADGLKTHYSAKTDADWVQAVAEYGRRIFRERTSVPEYVNARCRLKAAVITGMFNRFADDLNTLEACIKAFQRLTTIETDIILAQVALLEAIQAADQRGRESGEFERRVADLVRASTDQSKSLTERTRSTAASARGMLGKTSEVAAARSSPPSRCAKLPRPPPASSVRSRIAAPKSKSPQASRPAQAIRRARQSRSVRPCPRTSKRSNPSSA